jgi:hypothetical protein
MRSLPFLLALVFLAATPPTFPRHWGHPPAIQTRDLRPLPGGYGHGSSTLANWIQQNLDRDAAGKSETRDVVVGKGVTARGEWRQGSKGTLVIEGPSEKARAWRVSVRLRHESGSPEETIGVEQPSGPPKQTPQWLVSFTPTKAGEWTYRVSFRESLAPDAAEVATRSGRFSVAPAK